jgi:hypothetical protein
MNSAEFQAGLMISADAYTMSEAEVLAFATAYVVHCSNADAQAAARSAA